MTAVVEDRVEAALDWPAAWGPAPRWATRRDPSRRTYGAAVAALAAAMGTPLMPWQRYVADVALEVLDDGSWAYRTAFVTVPRQAGKTTLMGPVHVHRTMVRPAKGDGRARTWFTAQSRQDARDTWLEMIERVRQSPLLELVKVRESNGSESLTGPTGYFRVFAPSEDALHGKANQLVTVDEVWAFDGATGAALEQAIRPTFTTTGGQLWMVSTAGTARSSWMRGYVDRGRQAVDAGATSGLAYFEWSLDPVAAKAVERGLHPDAPAAERAAAFDLVVAHHPANGFTLDRGAVEDAADAPEMTAGDFLRAYGNVWTAVAERAIPAHVWARAGDDGKRTRFEAPTPGALSLAFDVAANRGDAAILAAWRPSPLEPLRVDVVDARPGTDWLVPRMVELAARWQPASIGHDSAGPVVDLADKLARQGVTLTATKTRDYVAACQGFLSGVESGDLLHRNQSQLDDAVEAAAVRPMGTQGQWAWDRRQAAATIAPLVAATVAAWLADHQPVAPSAPRIAYRRNDGLRPRRR